MRNRYIVAYDVRDPKRLRGVYLKMRGFGEPLQYSVFVCELSLKERALMISQLTDIINSSEDSIAIVDIGAPHDDLNKRIELIGRMPDVKERASVIV